MTLYKKLHMAEQMNTYRRKCLLMLVCHMLGETSRGDGMHLGCKCWSSPARLLNYRERGKKKKKKSVLLCFLLGT